MSTLSLSPKWRCDMRFYHFFMKFIRSFGVGFLCGMITVGIILACAFACYCVFFV